MTGWMNECMTGLMDDWMCSWLVWWMWVDDWLNGWLAGWMSGWLVGWWRASRSIFVVVSFNDRRGHFYHVSSYLSIYLSIYLSRQISFFIFYYCFWLGNILFPWQSWAGGQCHSPGTLAARQEQRLHRYVDKLDWKVDTLVEKR